LTRTIPFNKPALMGREISYLEQSIASGWISGDGEFTKRCEALLEDELGVPRVLLTTSCTHALEMAALLLDIGPGDEVVVPSFTFVSTANAFVLRGARPVFVDSRPDTLNLDESRLEAAITARTRAVVVMHYAGVACEMDEVSRIVSGHGIPVVEDNAHGLFGSYRGRRLGTFGALATQSFHETKNISCGEGGALLVNDERLVERAEILREKGTNRSLFFRGQIDKYSWVDIGSSYLPSDMLAAFLLAQLESRDEIQRTRRRIWETYREELHDWAADHGVRLPAVPPHCGQPYHLFYLLMPSLDTRKGLIERLQAGGIHAVFHYVPLHLSRMGRRFGAQPGDCPVALDVGDRLVRLPLFNAMRPDEQCRVVEAVLAFRP